MSIENITILVFSTFYYYEQIIKKNTLSIESKTSFWLVSAYFIYSAGIFFLYIFLATLSKSDQEKYYTLNYVFTILRTILLSIGLIMHSDISLANNKKKQKEVYK
jgi:hypothetical protein